MIGIAISILWLCIGIIVLGAVIWIALSVVHRFFPIMDPNVDYAVWCVFGILVLIYVLMSLSGASGSMPHLGSFR
jgi:hypothetical protein